MLGIWESFAKPERSKPSVGLRDRLAFEKAHPRFSAVGEVTLPKTLPSQEPKGDALVGSVKLLCAVKDFMDDITITKISEKKGTVLGIVEAEEVQQDILFALKEKIESFSKIVDEINVKASALNKDVQSYLVEKLEVIKLCNKFFTDKLFQKVEALKREKKELASPGEAPAARPAEAEEGHSPLAVREADEKQKSASSKAKKKRAKEELKPLGYQEKSSAEREDDRKQKLRGMVQGLRGSWKSLKFREIERAVKQLGGTIEPNGQDSHYIIKLKHIETGHLVLGATLRKKEKGGEYPWWKDSAVDALERAVGLITDDMSRIFEKIHPKKQQ